MSDDLPSLAKAVMAAQPFSRLLGCELAMIEPGRAELTMPITDQVRQQFGFVHGGVLSYLADNSLTFAAGSVLGASVVTVEHKLNYLRPARGDGRLVAIASVVDAGANQAVCRCEVYVDQGGDRRLCAAGQGTIRKVDAAG